MKIAGLTYAEVVKVLRYLLISEQIVPKRSIS